VVLWRRFTVLWAAALMAVMTLAANAMPALG